jgi:hypothetical protein
MLSVDWKSIAGAAQKRRRLSFDADEDGVYQCPVENCLHVGFKSRRGLRKHINTKHEWFYYFKNEPKFEPAHVKASVTRRLKASTHKQPSFSIQDGCGAEFRLWLETPCGGGKAPRESEQIAKRGMKFLMFSMGDNTDGSCANEQYIDCCIGSPTLLTNFLRAITEDWGLRASGALSYMRAIADLVDFRKASGVSDDVLRSLTVAEVYLRRGKCNLAKKKKVEDSRNLTMEALIARKSWATLEELQEVVPYHTPRYKSVLSKCKLGEEPPTTSELAFANRFITTFLFLRVKCTRPMSFQYMTLNMVEEAGTNGGFIDQTQFKTKEKFQFDTLILSDDVLDILNSYICHIRPLQSPKCEYAVISTAGTQFSAMGNALSLLVLQAIGKYYISPSRYRQIVETESSVRLSDKERETITKDQKHSSHVAKSSYQKSLSRDVAMGGSACMQKLIGDQREAHTSSLAAEVRDDPPSTEMESATEEVNSYLDEKDAEVIMVDNCTVEITAITIDDDAQVASTSDSCNDNSSIDPAGLEVKKEELEECDKKRIPFNEEEDKFLSEGYQKYAKVPNKWARILKDKAYKFRPGRTRDSLRVRATTLKLGKKKKSTMS